VGSDYGCVGVVRGWEGCVWGFEVGFIVEWWLCGKFFHEPRWDDWRRLSVGWFLDLHV
jgi:hypothetical protein